MVQMTPSPLCPEKLKAGGHCPVGRRDAQLTVPQRIKWGPVLSDGKEKMGFGSMEGHQSRHGAEEELTFPGLHQSVQRHFLWWEAQSVLWSVLWSNWAPLIGKSFWLQWLSRGQVVILTNLVGPGSPKKLSLMHRKVFSAYIFGYFPVSSMIKGAG